MSWLVPVKATLNDLINNFSDVVSMHSMTEKAHCVADVIVIFFLRACTKDAKSLKLKKEQESNEKKRLGERLGGRRRTNIIRLDFCIKYK